MKKLFVIAIGTVVLTSCGKKEEDKKVVTEQEIETPEIVVQDRECFLWTSKGKDTIKMSITTANGGNVVGDLEYNFYEKDGNKGKVSGMAKGDTLILSYDFESEGMKSMRESVFLRKGDMLIEGYGEVVTEGSNQKFKDKKALKFDEKGALKKVECDK